MDSSHSGNYIDFNQEWNYPLQWIQESYFARFTYQSLIYRVSQMLHGHPFRNLYKEDISSNLKAISEETREQIKNLCLDVPEGHSFALADAINTISNQMASGVDTYQYTIDDPFMVIGKDLEQRLATQCSLDYTNNNLDIYAGTFSEDIMAFGLCAVLVKYDPKHNKNIIERIHPKNTWVDTMYHSNGRERYRGYSTMISWAKLKKMVSDDEDEINLNIVAPNESIFDEKGDFKKAKYKNRKIRTLNGLDIYVADLNKLAASPGLQGIPHIFGEYDHDLLQCYNLGWYRSYATDAKARTENGYDGDDVELTVIYDLNRKIEFKIINRRYVISMNKRAFRRGIFFKQTNPLTNAITYRYRKEKLDCPLKFAFLKPNTMDSAPYPYTPVFDLLDTHDAICGWLARREHVSKILSILRIETNGADASSMQELFNIMGIVIDDVQGPINSINFQYSYDPIDSQIERLSTKIQNHLSAYTQLDALQMMGDRASAAESGMAVGAIAQGLANLQNSLMHLYASIARQCLMNRVLYSPSEELTIVNNGNYSNITIQDMALHAIIKVKSAMAKKVYQKQLAANSMAILGSMGQEFTPTLKALLIEQALYGQVPSKIVEENLANIPSNSQEIAIASQMAQNQALALQQNQALYEQNPIPYETQNIVDNYTSDEINQVIGGLSQDNNLIDQEQDTLVTALDMPNQEGAMAVGLATQTSDLGSELANPSSMV